MNTDALLDLIIDRAPRLRAAGVRRVMHGDICIEIDPADPVIVTTAASASPEPEEHGDPLLDPATFGRRAGTPGFDISDIDHNDHDEH